MSVVVDGYTRRVIICENANVLFIVVVVVDRLCVEVTFIFPVGAESGHIVLIILFIDDDEHILRPFRS